MAIPILSWLVHYLGSEMVLEQSQCALACRSETRFSLGQPSMGLGTGQLCVGLEVLIEATFVEALVFMEVLHSKADPLQTMKPYLGCTRTTGPLISAVHIQTEESS